MEKYLELLLTFSTDKANDKGEVKLKTIQEITENFETILSSPSYSQFLEAAIPTFLKFFDEGEPHFVAEYQLQQARKAVLELLHRLPANEVLRPFVRPILTAVFRLLGIDNEENVLICLRIVIELHKQYRPQFSAEVQNFLIFVRSVYKDLPRHMEKIFEPKLQVKVKDLSEINVSSSPALDEIYAVTSFQSDKKTAEGTTQSYTVLPKARNSLKVLQELPIIVVLMYQIYKTNVQQEVADFIPIVMSTITLQPNENHRTSTGFNKEVLVEFMGAQVKTLSFLAYIIKLYQDLVILHSELLVNGLINLLTLCPMEVAYLRRELFIAARHIMATELRFKFVPHMDKLFNEEILLGKGWTVNESMRPLAYSTLADLVHHVRQHLSLSDLNKAVTFFSYHVHDETLPLSIQTMSCKLLFNLVESIRLKSESENGNGREILMKMLDMLAYKFKMVSQVHIPFFAVKFNALAAAHNEKKPEAEQSVEDILSRGFSTSDISIKEDTRRFGFPQTPMQSYVFHECRTLVKTVVCAVKTISWGIASCKTRGSPGEVATAGQKQFSAKETDVYLRLMKWGLKAVDIYALNGPVTNVSGQTMFIPQRTINTQGVRSKEEKEVLEHFAGAFTLLNTYTFREIFSVRMKLLVERIHENNALQVVANNLLANPTTSAVFATILVEFLLEKLPDMGEDAEKSGLYLRLYKLVFGSVSLFPSENEQMLKPHLREIVNRSMELALNAKDPYNYFLLLRALFRSIGGGSHDLLYQEFLPLLPSLLQGLNSLQSGLHKQHIKDLFVELCLTVPVRLSSLLPYLPMLMDPLVSALNGSPTLVSQGLRTLELCVDNLQPDFLYEHIQPVRADLMQALWRTLRNPADTTATVAYRILGKFGGSNRKMLVEPQKLEFGDKTNQGPQVQLYFQDHKASVSLPVEKPIEAAYNLLKSQTAELHYKKHAWQLLKSYLVASMVTDEDRYIVNKGMLHSSLHSQEITNATGYKYSDEKSRQVHATALSGVFIAAMTKELKQEVYNFLIPLMRHYGMIAVAQQIGPFLASKCHGMDPYVIFDAAANVLAGEEKEFEHSVFFSLSVLMNLLINMVGTKERACSLQMIEYLTEKVCTLCYERAWYTKMGGCNAIDFLLDHMSSKWILTHHINILKAMVFVLTDLSGEVSSGAVEAAKHNLDKVLRICAAIEDNHLSQLRESSLSGVTIELVRHVTSSVANVREQSMKNLRLLAELQGKTLSEIILPHIAVIADMIPPKKHLIRHQSLQSQLGILDGNSFCLSITPKIFSIDVTLPEHRTFINEIILLCEHDDAALVKYPCYKGVQNLFPVRIAILKVLGCVVVGSPAKEKIISLFLKSLANSNRDLQSAAFESMRKFMVENTVEVEIVSQTIRSVLVSLTKGPTLELIRHAAFLYQLVPDTNNKIWETFLQILRKFLENALKNHSNSPNKTGFHEFKIVIAIVEHFGLLTDSPDPQVVKFAELVCKLCLQAERALALGKGSQLRPNLMKYLGKLPQEYISQVFTVYLTHPEWNRFFLYFLKQPNAGNLREALKLNIPRIVHCLGIRQNPVNPISSTIYTEKELSEIQYLGVKCVSILSHYDENFILSQTVLFKALKTLWETPDYQQGIGVNYRKLDVQSWKEPMCVCKVLLLYYKRNPDDICLLFSLLLAFCGKTVSQYQFLKEFLETTVTLEYSVSWKRQAFLQFVEIFGDESYPSDLKAKIIQYILIPCMTHCFEQGLGDEFVGSTPMPDVDSPDNIVSVLLSRVIDAENPNAQSDSVRIVLCQLSCLLVEVAAAHIHDASNKKQGNKLRRLMTFAWPCLLSKTCVDSSTKYYGHLLLSHIIAKFAIHKRIVLQVFHSLLKASAMEAKSVIRQALEIITPALPLRMEDGNTMLIHWTKKILVEEGHSLAQLTHILQLIVRHWKVYFPVRLLLITHMINAIQRLGFTPSSTLEHRRLAVELSEVIIKWELERIKIEGEDVKPVILTAGKVESGKNLERAHTDAVVNFLLRMACQVNDSTPTPGSPGELLSRRCVTLLKTVLKPHIWPTCDLKLVWFDKLLLTLETPQANFLNICTALDLLTFITGILTKEQVLEQFKGLQKGIAACMISQNNKVIRAVHNLMTKLMTIYPTDFPGGSSTMVKCEELDILYGHVSKLVFDALVNYEKIPTPSPSTLLGPLMMLKSACTANPCYIDRIITAFMKVVQRLFKDHLTATGSSDAQGVGTDLLVLSMDLVKNRVGVMGVEMRKAFIGTVLVGLIEKTNDSKVMQGIVKMLEEWVKNKTPIVVNQGPSSREKSILLVRMMQNAEKRFSHDQELVGQFLELVNFIYRDDHLKGTELNVKLEPAFLAGLRCTQSVIRKKFFEVFDSSIRKRLHDRLMYIMCSQNWEAMGPHYWIKQCIELLFSTVADVDIQVIPPDMILPGIAHGFHFLDAAAKDFLLSAPDIKGEPMDIETPFTQVVENDLDLLQSVSETETQEVTDLLTRIEEMFMKNWNDPPAPIVNVKTFLMKELDFMSCQKHVKLSTFVNSMIQLCHYDTNLAEKVWITFFPRAWKIFSEKHQMAIANEIVPFMCSGVHVVQKDCFPSALNTFAEAICQCVPSVSMKPIVLSYLARNHNLWHRMSLVLEQYVLETGNTQQLKAKPEQADCYEFEPSTSSQTQLGQNIEVMDTLSDLYSSLKEEDLWAGLWQRRAKYPETNIGIAFLNQGFYEKAQGAFELAMVKAGEDFEEEACPGSVFPEFKLWEETWLKCAKELNQWDIVQDYGSGNEGKSYVLELDSVWRQGNWNSVKDLLGQVETAAPREFSWKVQLYRGYHSICSTDDQNLTNVDHYVDAANQICIKDWRKLPHLVSNVHVPILQAAQQIVELHEATQIHQGFIQGRPNTLHDMKAVVKTWRNRLPCISDDLSHWGDIFTWRQQHYNFISSQFDGNGAGSESSGGGGSQGMLGVHASAQAICYFGKIARKQNLHSVCLDSLSKIYAIPSVPIVDCFQKIKQQVKCYIQQAQVLGRNELQEALEIVESTNLKYFSKEMTAEFFSLKACLLSLIGRSDEANKAYSASCQLNDSLGKAWGFWGDYLEGFYARDPARNVNMGICAMTAYMQACRQATEIKCRKYIAKVIWLLTYDDDKGTYADIVDKYSAYVPPIQWLPWVPQLLTLLVRHDGKMVINLLNAVGRMYPQAVYFPIRTLYLTLKVEQREKVRNAELAAAAYSSHSTTSAESRSEQEGSAPNTQTQAATQPGEVQAIKATPSMWRCSRIMHMQRDLHPTVLSSLEGIVDQIIWFRENWCEEVLRQLRIGLAKCYAIAFENRSSVLEAVITHQLQNFVKKVVSTFGHAGFGTSSGSVSTSIEALLRRSTMQDPTFQSMKARFALEFDPSAPGALKLHNMIINLRKWIKILEAKIKLYSQSFLMEDRFRFLQNFSTQMAEIELPGEFLIPKHAHYYVKIARFQPRVEVVQKHNTSARRIFIRGHNGKIYPYLIVNDSGLTDARREERVMQMLRMMNHYLLRQKITAKRNLKFTVPKVVAVSPQMRLVEDNPSSLSLLDVFKHSCSKRGVEYDAAITRYYEKIAAIQTRGAQVSHQVLREILRDIQANIVPRTMMKEWALNTFSSPSDYWMFRKTFTLQLALADFAEYSFHLTRLNPEMMYLHQDSGMVNISYFKFELDDTSGELESNRPVPFRLTPNISEFVTPFGVCGPIVSSMISLARCLVYPNYKVQSILRAILRDEMIAWLQKKQNDREIMSAVSGAQEPVPIETDSEAVISRVTKSVTSMMNRIQLLSSFDGTESKVNTLVAAANSHDNLCRMDPAWHPWL